MIEIESETGNENGNENGTETGSGTGTGTEKGKSPTTRDGRLQEWLADTENVPLVGTETESVCGNGNGNETDIGSTVSDTAR